MGPEMSLHFMEKKKNMLHLKKTIICQSWTDDIGFSLTPPPLISTHIVNLQTPPPLNLADVFYGRPLSSIS